MKRYIIVLIIILVSGCQTKKDSKIEEPEKRYGTETKVFGDSLKVIYEYKGDTIIQNRIDLKGTSDDSFDSSFKVVSIWSSRYATNLDCRKVLIFNNEDILFKFCVDSVIKKLGIDTENYTSDELEKIRNDIYEIKSNGKGILSDNSFDFTISLLRDASIEFDAFDNKTNTEIKKILFEKYETNFSGGTNYYLINMENDTIRSMSINEWMR